MIEQMRIVFNNDAMAQTFGESVDRNQLGITWEREGHVLNMPDIEMRSALGIDLLNAAEMLGGSRPPERMN
jgi:hypothetical protein